MCRISFLLRKGQPILRLEELSPVHFISRAAVVAQAIATAITILGDRARGSLASTNQALIDRVKCLGKHIVRRHSSEHSGLPIRKRGAKDIGEFDRGDLPIGAEVNMHTRKPRFSGRLGVVIES